MPWSTEFGRVDERAARLAGRSPADAEEVLPVAIEQLGDLGAIGRQTGGGEQVGAVADALRADVRAVRDEVAVGVGRGGFLPVEPAARGWPETGARRSAYCMASVNQSISTASTSARPESAEASEVVRPGVVRRRGLVVHDLDAGLLGELGEQLVGVAEVVERREGQGDLLVFASSAAAASRWRCRRSTLRGDWLSGWCVVICSRSLPCRLVV